MLNGQGVGIRGDFSISPRWSFRLGQSLLWGGLVHCRVFISIPGLYPLLPSGDARTTPPPSSLLPPSSFPLSPAPGSKVETTKNVSRRCQKSPAGNKQPGTWAPLMQATSKFLAIWLVGYQGGAGALVSLGEWIVSRHLDCAQGRAERWSIKHFPNPLRFAKQQAFKESPCCLLINKLNNKKHPRDDPCSSRTVSSPAPGEALAVSVVGRWISQTGKYLGIGRESPAE